MATVKELRVRAEELDIDHSGMKKADLESAIREAEMPSVKPKLSDLNGKAVVKAVDGGQSFQSLSEDLETSLGDVIWTYWNTKGPAIEADDTDDLANLIVEARDNDKTPWVQIAGRAGVTKGAVRKLYATATGRDATESNIGRGGRGAGGEYLTKDDADKAKAKPKAKKVSAKAKTAKKATAKTKVKGRTKKAAASAPDIDWQEASEEDVTAALEGQTVTHAKGVTTVSEVLRFGKNKSGSRVIQIADEDGDKVNITLSTVKSVD